MNQQPVPAAADAAARAEAEGVTLVWFRYAGHGGIISGKAAPTATRAAR